MSCAYFVSDLHLTDSDGPKARVFVAFLDRLLSETENGAADRPTHLFLVGDIFDFWIGAHDYFEEKFAPIVARIRALISRGVEVHYFEGNHDLHLTEFWMNEVGAIVHTDADLFEIDGRRIRVEHGDLINPDDRGYLFLRWLLRVPPMRMLAHGLPASTVRMIGERASRASRKHTSTRKGLPDTEVKRLIRRHAETAYRETPFDLLVCGHVHVVEDGSIDFGGRVARFVNLGAWFEGARAFRWSRGQGDFVQLK